MKQIISVLFAFLLIVVGASDAKAAFVTTNETDSNGGLGIGMDDIFAPASIDIRFNPTVVIANPALLNIDTEQEINDLFGLAGSGPTVFMFFVDTIDFCSIENPAIIGCGALDGNAIAVESVAAAGANGAELNAHELGHALNLEHDADPANLMFGSISGGTALTAGQITTIQASQFVQSDAEGMFVEITPVLLSAVPVPPAGILFLSGVLCLYWLRRRGRTATA